MHLVGWFIGIVWWCTDLQNLNFKFYVTFYHSDVGNRHSETSLYFYWATSTHVPRDNGVQENGAFFFRSRGFSIDLTPASCRTIQHLMQLLPAVFSPLRRKSAGTSNLTSIPTSNHLLSSSYVHIYLLFEQSNPDVTILFVYRSFFRYIMGCGKSKYCLTL